MSKLNVRSFEAQIETRMAEKVAMKKDNFRYVPINSSDNLKNCGIPNYPIPYLLVVCWQFSSFLSFFEAKRCAEKHLSSWAHESITIYTVTNFRRATKIYRQVGFMANAIFDRR